MRWRLHWELMHLIPVSLTSAILTKPVRAPDSRGLRYGCFYWWIHLQDRTILGKSATLPGMRLILILLVLILVFGGGGYYMGPGVGYYGGGGLSLVLLVVIIVLLFGRGRRGL